MACRSPPTSPVATRSPSAATWARSLNLADVPSVVAELGNMRDAADARRMTSRAGRATYAAALVAAILGYLR